MNGLENKVRELQRSKKAPRNSDAPEVLTDTDIANAARLARRHGQDIHFTVERGWLVYDGKRWAVDEKVVQIQALAKDAALAIFEEIKDAPNRDEVYRHARKSQSKQSIEAMIYLARSEEGIFTRLSKFDADPMLLNVQNGTLDLKTGTLRPHHRDDLLSMLVPVEFDVSARCELWETFLRRITGDSTELHEYLSRLVGYLLTGSTSEQVLHFLYGLGANGKSVFCEVVAELLGEYAIVASPELIMTRRHAGIPNDIARLRGARCVLMNETSQGSRFDEAKLKDLTGGDKLTGRFLHAEFFDFMPTHKLIIRGNHKPAISGTDEGIWRRLRLVPFTVEIPAEEQDRGLIEKLRAELPGILRWAVKGCLEWQRIGLNPPGAIIDAVSRYRTESDTLGRFIDENCEQSKLAQVRSSIFFQRYQHYTEKAGERWMPAKDLPHEMQRRGFDWKRTKTGGMYFGLQIRLENESHWQDTV